MKYYVIAGEASGDLHASNLMKALSKEDPEADFRIWGGDLMQDAGGDLVKHYRDLAFMGFVEVAMNIRTILGNIRFCKEDILKYQPDVLLLVDYPGFNLRIAKWAKKEGIRVFYYISPQIWAWHSSRAKGIRASIERMFVILPFEKDFYKKYDYEVDFVGHPLLDVIENAPETARPEKPVVALLPGSRKQEINRMLPLMLDAAKDFPNFEFIVAGAPSMSADFYAPILAESTLEVSVVFNETYPLLRKASAALVTSGTATLETALFGVPQVVCYQGNTLSYLIARQLVQVKHISLVNLIADQPLVPELIQSDCSPARIREELGKLVDENH